MHDLVILGATVVDGSGRPGFPADVAVRDGRITEVGRLGTIAARRTLRADGMVVAPGFIDLHAHSDLMLLERPEHELKVLQGVTTELLGQDGLSYAPIAPGALPLMRDMIGLAADLVVFDPLAVAPRNSYEDARVPPAGMPCVIVNGVPVKWDDQPTGERPGRIIRGDGTGRAQAA